MNEFVCEDCNREFNSQRSINMHNRAKHPEKVEAKAPSKQVYKQTTRPSYASKKKISILSPILYGLVAVFFILLIIFINDDKQIRHSLKLKRIVKTSFVSNEPSITIWGPIKLSKVDKEIYIRLSTNQLKHYGNKESWVAGEMTLVETSKLENYGNLKSVNELKKILKIDQPKNVSFDKGKQMKILEDYSLEYNFWYATGNDWAESDLEKTKYIEVDKPKDYYVLMEYYTNKINFNANGFNITVVEGVRLVAWYIGGFIISLLIFIFSFISYLKNRKLN